MTSVGRPEINPGPVSLLIAAGMLTTRQLGELLGVKHTTISRWRKQGLIEGPHVSGGSRRSFAASTGLAEPDDGLRCHWRW
ncbi:MAG TPA: helix-turn-helix domain-containing protein [Kofleriaceae bacterium]|jgi:hypothetical protein|nr:helix-turn-helix domain-containing protein [Kofleriaceae bacterium]